MATAIVEIPELVRAEVPGCEPVLFGPEDFTSEQAYLRLVKGSPWLKKSDFTDENQFKRYFLLSAGLTEGNIIIAGPEGSGKSLFSYHLAYHERELFGKPCTLTAKPKKEFGTYMTINPEELLEEIDNLRRLTGMANDLVEEDDLPEWLQQRLKQTKLYNRVFVVDEAYQDIEKSRRTNLTRAYGRLVRQWRHLHNLFIFVSPDPRDIDRRMIFDRRTHEVRCSKLGDRCFYTIWWRTQNITKSMELVPANWGHIWNSWNLVGGGSSLKIKL